MISQHRDELSKQYSLYRDTQSSQFFMPYPNALQMVFDDIVPSDKSVICKVVLLLTAPILFKYDRLFLVSLPGVILLTNSVGRDSNAANRGD